MAQMMAESRVIEKWIAAGGTDGFHEMDFSGGISTIKLDT